MAWPGVQGHFEKKRLFLEHVLCRVRFDETDSLRRNVSVTNLESSFDRGGLYVECFFWWGENYFRERCLHFCLGGFLSPN